MRCWRKPIPSSDWSNRSGICKSIRTALSQRWRNGSLVIDYIGALGYSDGSINYLKAGYYHWTNAGNNWDATLPERTLYYKGPWVIDPARSSPGEAIDFIAST